MLPKRWTRWRTRSPYGIGWRTRAGFSPSPSRSSATRRVVWLLPAPVRVAQTATTGLRLRSMVRSGPSRVKSAPAASTRDATCITVSWLTSL